MADDLRKAPLDAQLAEAWRTNNRITLFLGIMLTLEECGEMPGKDVAYGIWGWDQR